MVNQEEEQQLYRHLLAFLEKINWQGQPVLGFRLGDDAFEFVLDERDLVQQELDILKESHASDRMLVIVCLAYLEDQLRILLKRFLVEHAVTDKLLNPVANGTLSPFGAMVDMALALGLITQDWHRILKRMAALRNIFAHNPHAVSFDHLQDIDASVAGLLDSLVTRHSELTGENPSNRAYSEIFLMLFRTMASLVQLSEHLATKEQRFQPERLAVQGIWRFHSGTIDLDTLRDLTSNQ